MPSWTHLIRFIAVEDNLVHLGQLVDTSRDIGEDSVKGVQIAAYVINGTIYDGRATGKVMHVKQVGNPNIKNQALLTIQVALADHSRGVQLYPLPWTELHGSRKSMLLCFKFWSKINSLKAPRKRIWLSSKHQFFSPNPEAH